MSYQYTTTTSSGQHRLNEFVPTYVPKSDYLPTRVQEQNQGQANEWVPSHISLACQLRETKTIGPCLHSAPRRVQPQSVCLRQDLRKCFRQQAHQRERVQLQSQEILIFIDMNHALLTISLSLPPGPSFLLSLPPHTNPTYLSSEVTTSRLSTRLNSSINTLDSTP